MALSGARCRALTLALLALGAAPALAGGCAGSEGDVLWQGDAATRPVDAGDDGCRWLTWWSQDVCLNEAAALALARGQCALLPGTKLVDQQLLSPCAAGGWQRVRARCCPLPAPQG